jgi:hypothetical protein
VRGEPAERTDRVEHALLHLAPDAARPEVEPVGPVDGRDRNALRGESRLQPPVERKPLQRVVERAVAVEVAAEPAGDEALVERAHLPEVPRGEMRLVRVVVADAGHDADLALAVQRRQRRERRMPAQPVVLREHDALVGPQGKLRAQLAVERIAGRCEQRE